MHQDLLNINSHIGDQCETTPSFSDNWCITDSGAGISHQQYLHDVSYLANRLPDSARFALNLCKDRYHFLVAFHAVALKGQTSLLPPNQAPGIQRELLKEHNDCYIVCDEPLTSHLDAPIFQIAPLGKEKNIQALHSDTHISPNHLAAILFTSGTSGKPNAIHKRWGELQAGVQLTAARFGLNGHGDRHLVATVPPQHMFGLEMSIMLPLTCGTGLISDRPFFPEDIRQTLNSAPGRTVLVTTPFHLKACIDSGLDWLDCGCDLIISATAPLSRKLAAIVEERFRTPVKEIYGSTETGALATRHTVKGDEWRFYPGITARAKNNGYLVSGGHLVTPCRLNDCLQIQANGRFKLLGRHSDMIKLAGKRASLCELNQKLNQISGVIDGAFFDAAEAGQETKRLAAVVVAPGMGRRELRKALAEWMDPAFLPRPLLFTNSLPRNETGKLPRQVLRGLLRS